MATGFFPADMVNSNLNIDRIAAKLSYFQEQVKLKHWQTDSYSEHKALDSIYDTLVSMKDDIIEKLIGYTGNRPKSVGIPPFVDNINSMKLMDEINIFSMSLKTYAESNKFIDISNLADTLSGEVNKTKYLLTLK